MSTGLNNFLTWFSAVGSLITIIGVIVNWWQIKRVKTIATETRNGMNNTSAIADISKCNELIYEISAYLNGGKLELAVSKLRELKTLIVELKIIVPKLKIKDIGPDYPVAIGEHINRLSSAINNIESNYKSPTLINTGFITQRLDDLSTYIIEVKTHLSNNII